MSNVKDMIVQVLTSTGVFKDDLKKVLKETTLDKKIQLLETIYESIILGNTFSDVMNSLIIPNTKPKLWPGILRPNYSKEDLEAAREKRNEIGHLYIEWEMSDPMVQKATFQFILRKQSEIGQAKSFIETLIKDFKKITLLPQNDSIISNAHPFSTLIIKKITLTPEYGIDDVTSFLKDRKLDSFVDDFDGVIKNCFTSINYTDSTNCKLIYVTANSKKAVRKVFFELHTKLKPVHQNYPDRFLINQKMIASVLLMTFANLRESDDFESSVKNLAKNLSK